MKWSVGSGLAAAAALVAVSLAAASAGASVRLEGPWPDANKPVSIEATGMPRAEALRKLADTAGWSLVVHGLPGEPVDLHVKAQPASKVLDLLLDDGDYVARRDGTLVLIEPAGAASPGVAPSTAAVPPAAVVPPVPPVPPTPPTPGPAPAPAPADSGLSIHIGNDSSEVDEPHVRGKDRTVLGGNVRIARGEVARDVTVFGGNVDIEGQATGDVSVFGGNVRVHPGARVHGDATVFGGTLSLDDGARVDGDVNAVGGALRRSPGSHVGGDVTTKGADDDDHGHSGAGIVGTGVPAKARGFFASLASSLMDGLRLATVLFVIGTVLIALAGRRVDGLRGEIAARPMRSIALGLLGTFASVIVLVALCVTIVGIPVAVVAAIVGGFAVLGAMCAVLSVVGEGLLRHKTENPYVHLAVGCALFVALSWVPWLGGLIVAAVVLAGIGALFATRGAGFFPKKNGGAPYRSPDPL